MFRGTAPRLTVIALVSATAAYVAVPFALPVQAEPIEHQVTAANTAFMPRERGINVGDTVTWSLGQGETNHAVTLDRNGDREFTDDELAQTVELNQSSPTFSYTFTTAGSYGYFCYHHLGSGMTGAILVAAEPPPTTTTTTAPPPPTTTTTAPAPPPPPPTTTTTRPRATTTTTRPPAPTPTTQPPAAASGETTDTTARATTTTAKPKTTTSKKKPTTTTKPPETTTTTTAPALPADWIPTPGIVPGDVTTTTTGPDLEAALTSRPKAPRGGGGGGFPIPMAGAMVLGALILGGGGYAWYHRGSRYLPA